MMLFPNSASSYSRHPPTEVGFLAMNGDLVVEGETTHEQAGMCPIPLEAGARVAGGAGGFFADLRYPDFLDYHPLRGIEPVPPPIRAIKGFVRKPIHRHCLSQAMEVV